MSVKNYDPKMIMIVVGNIPVQGFGDGTFVNVEQNEDSFTLQKGSDGEGARSRTNNDSARITLTLLQTSASNDLLSALHRADKAIPGGVGVVPLLIKDLLGRTLHQAESCWIVKPPTMEMGREAGSREWVLECDSLDSFDGGNF